MRFLSTTSLAASLALSAHALAQTTTTPATNNSSAAAKSTATTSTYTATISVDSTFVRCAPNTESGYPFGELSRGQTVTVDNPKPVPGWVRIRIEGAPFQGWAGFVPALPGVTLSADGKSIKVTGTASINAPNGTADFNPESSWKPVGFLTAGNELPVIEVVKGQRDTFYAVPLSGSSTYGYIAESALERMDGGTAANTTPNATTPNETTPNSTTPNTTSTDGGTSNTDTATTNTTDTAKKPADAAKPAATSPKKRVAEPRPETEATRQRARFEALETKWQSLQKTECDLADLKDLHTGFLTISENAEASEPTRKNARTRSMQVASVVELRELKARSAEVATRSKLKNQEVVDLEKWLLARQQHDAIGILNASLVYDGERLPRLYRLQDPVSGFTTAYLMEDPELKLSSMLGLVVGVKGDKHFDESLRRTVITPKTVAVLQSGAETEIAPPSAVGAASGGSDESGK